MSFPKMTVTHAELCDATKDGPITMRLVGEPVKAKYPVKGRFSAVQNFQFNNRAYQYQIPNDAICAVLEQHVGSMVSIQASGVGAEQAVEIEEVAAPAASLPPKQAQSRCLVCGEPQFDSPTSGVTCKNGHGGAPAMSLPPTQAARQQAAATQPDTHDSRVSCEHGRPIGEDCAGCAMVGDKPTPKRIGRMKSLIYGRTLKVRDYENFRLEIQIELSDGDDASTAYQTLLSTVDTKCDAILAKLKKTNTTK